MVEIARLCVLFELAALRDLQLAPPDLPLGESGPELRGAPAALRVRPALWNSRWTTGCSGASCSRTTSRHSSKPNASPASS
eukprot:10235091-Alexandrium_andersonii.AAC.1